MKNIMKALSGKIAGGIVLCLIAVIFFSCMDKPLSPVAPTTDIALNSISIVDVTKYFKELTDKSKGMQINPDNTISYIDTQLMAPKKTDTIKVQPDSSSQQVSVGKFGVDAFFTSQNISATSLGFPSSGSVPVLDAAISAPPVLVNDTSEFYYIAVETGSIMLTITNNLPVPIDFPQPIVLRNNWSSPLDVSIVAVFSISDTLNPGQSTNLPPVQIDGILVRGLLTTDSIQFHTVGSLTPVTFTPSSGLAVSLQSSSLTADSALAKIPSQSITSVRDSIFTVDDSVFVRHAEFSQGNFQIVLQNNLDISTRVYFAVNEFRWISNGTSYSIDTTLQGRETFIIPVDASQIEVQSNAPASQIGTKLTFSVGITTISSEGVKRTVTKNDYVQGYINPGTPLIVRSVTGKIKPQTISINSTIKSGIDLKDIKDLSVDSIIFSGIQMTSRFPMTGGFPMDYHLSVVAKLNGQLVDSIQVGTDILFPRLYPDNPVITLSNAANFDDFVSHCFSNSFPEVPDSFIVRGYLLLNPLDEFLGSNLYTIDDTSTIRPSLDINLPFAAGIINGRMTETVGLGEGEIPRDVTKNIGQGKITFYCFNHIPMNMSFSARFTGNYDTPTRLDDTLLYIPQRSDSAYAIESAPVATTGSYMYTSGDRVSVFTVLLNAAEMELFNMADSLYLRFDINTSNNGSVVQFKNTDYIRVYAKGDITFTVNKP